MTAPARALGEGLPVILGSTVTELRHDDGAWSVYATDGLIQTPGNGKFSTVILAVPAPQAAPLAASAGVVLPQLEKVRYAPCWALMLAFAEPVGLRDDRHRLADDAIAWIARNGSKPGRSHETETVVVHATPDWSRPHLEWSPDAAASELIARFQSVTGISAQPYFSTAHRWRYALVEEAAGPAFLWDEDVRLGACGDWCLGPRVEAALDSGEALAKRSGRHRSRTLASERPALTLYFDGSCPLCRAEIAHYRRQDGASQLTFRDISQTGEHLDPDLAREQAIARFHVRRSDGQLVSGAAAFVSIWRLLPRWRWAARIAALPGMMAMLEGAYRLFLPARPVLAAAFGRINAWRHRRGPVANRCGIQLRPPAIEKGMATTSPSKLPNEQARPSCGPNSGRGHDSR
jgi:predicted DCC family thiol-disulfide oxidoreductase YuxK